jgi:hypothetical protein
LAIIALETGNRTHEADLARIAPAMARIDGAVWINCYPALIWYTVFGNVV